MYDNTLIVKVVKIILTTPLAIISIAGIAGYIYIDIRGLYKEQERRWWVGLLAIGLPMVSFISGIGILMVWQPWARHMFWVLLLFAGIVSIILRQSIISPYELADWWSQFGNWWRKEKIRRR